MRPVLLLSAATITFTLAAASAVDAGAQTAPKPTLEKQVIDSLLGRTTKNTGGLNETDAAAGIREALAMGVDRSVRQLGTTDGFFRDQAVKILVPEKLRRVADLARQLGAGKRVDEFELSMNRAAERAVPAAANILADAVRQMTLQDAISLVRGDETSATHFFRRTSEQKLFDAFRPIVAEQTAKVGVTKKYKALSKKVGGNTMSALLGGTSTTGNTADLDDYVTREAIDGLFHVIAEQEKSIRRDPVARTTELLRKVFK